MSKENIESQPDPTPKAIVEILDSDLPIQPPDFEIPNKSDKRKIPTFDRVDPSTFARQDKKSRKCCKKLFYVALYLTTAYFLLYTVHRHGPIRVLQMWDEFPRYLYIICVLHLVWFFFGDASVSEEFRQSIRDFWRKCKNCCKKSSEPEYQYQEAPRLI
ncbi:hypothetical protein WR25_26934 [Diploscapter pachys]|uniref:Uncharacterized protein n=1 Tax=Diploscapter pachys TaxID=2018661 RepID=A0A2A2JUR3_9BILA|nr:hypothetical protein WR25_26934 [Diploscapter pachys]